MIELRVILMCGAMMILALGGDAGVVSPEDDVVSGFLESHGLDAMLEVQLFDRLRAEDDGANQIELADRLGRVYLEALRQPGLGPADTERVLVKSRVLIGMVPSDSLLELRLALLIERYRLHEQSAELDRIGLLEQESKWITIADMREIIPEFTRIAALSNVQALAFGRSAVRATGIKKAEFERKLASARGSRSRANFFLGWSSYTLAVLSDKTVSADAFRGFGWVLGFSGKMPVLDQVNLELLEYDHVARAMIGVALCKEQNGGFGEARVWLAAVERSTVAPRLVVDIGHQRQLDIVLSERDWIESQRRALMLQEMTPDSLLGVAQARLLVLRSLGVLEKPGTGRVGRLGRGGAEGIEEVARLGIDRLIDLGEIGHVLDLQQRLGSIPLMSSGFVSLYVQGLAEMADGKQEDEENGYGPAAEFLTKALDSDDAMQYRVHAGDASLKLAFCNLQIDHPGEAVDVLKRFGHLFDTDKQREESHWLQVLAYGAAVSEGQDQLVEQLKLAIRGYIRKHPLTPRTSSLIVQYTLTPYLDPKETMDYLVIDDPNNSLGVPARRKLIQLLYKNPGFIQGGDQELYSVIVGHARWLWEMQSLEILNGKERLTVCRIVLGLGLKVDSPDLGFLHSVIDRGEQILEKDSSLDQMSSELAFRRLQVLLREGDVDRAGKIALADGRLDESVFSAGLMMVYQHANTRFEETPTVSFAQSVILYGRGVIGASVVVQSDGLDRRLSRVAEAMARAALYLAREIKDPTMREYALALRLRVFHEGVPSEFGYVDTAELAEQFGHPDIALECWLKLVGRLQGDDELWHRSRYESLRLLSISDYERGRAVYRQYVALYPEGSPEPYGEMVEKLFPLGGGGSGGGGANP